MAVCYINPDGSHVRGCEPHRGEHPYRWCKARREQRDLRRLELSVELAELQRQADADLYGPINPGPHEHLMSVTTTHA